MVIAVYKRIELHAGRRGTLLGTAGLSEPSKRT